ncbi:yeast-form wall Protein 1 [[Candida] jaroonii]|uniref:Yeast-form wall Protein 1 n=1 Tax=[Candida] jaroonii TaxID=467808 RepID=A0ACA9Y0S7_9ASCO|nr:yeast-form wall Protein 1 [[Candida] jaroonii]
MKFTSVLSTAVLAATAIAQDVACLVNGEQVAVVDLDTGVCPFTVPAALPVAFDFVSLEEYDVTFYYAVAQAVKYFTDIVGAGRLIEIPAIALYGTPGVPLFQVHLEASPAANSTAAIRRRLLKQVELVKKAEIDDFLAIAEQAEGVAVAGNTFAVVDLSSSSAGASTTGATDGTATVTDSLTTIVTITSCSNDVCASGTVPATASEVVTTVDETVYTTTTYCPVATVVTITSCKDNKCHESTVPATPSLTTETIAGEVTSYYTYCPLTEDQTEVVTEEIKTVVTITSCSDNKCHETVVPVTPATTVVTGTTVAGESTTEAAPTSSSPSTVASISTYGGSAAKVGGSLLAIIPLFGLLL